MHDSETEKRNGQTVLHSRSMVTWEFFLLRFFPTLGYDNVEEVFCFYFSFAIVQHFPPGSNSNAIQAHYALDLL